MFKINKNIMVYLFLSLFLVIMIAGCESESLIEVSIERLPGDYLPIELRLKGYCPKEGKKYVNFYVSNQSVLINEKTGRLEVDFDRDGLINSIESDQKAAELFNISPFKEDTNNDGYSDLVIYLLGLKRKEQENLRPCEDMEQDTDQDGLTDCEENNAIHSDAKNFDTDFDGVPDDLEMRNGMNPLDPADINQDPDMDGFTNQEEIRMHTPINYTNTKFINRLAYRYTLDTYENESYSDEEVSDEEVSDEDVLEDLENNGKDCYSFVVSQIGLRKISNGNIIKIYLTEKTDNTEVTLRTFRVLMIYDDTVRTDTEACEYDRQVLTCDFEKLVEGA